MYWVRNRIGLGIERFGGRSRERPCVWIRKELVAACKDDIECPKGPSKVKAGVRETTSDMAPGHRSLEWLESGSIKS